MNTQAHLGATTKTPALRLLSKEQNIRCFFTETQNDQEGPSSAGKVQGIMTHRSCGEPSPALREPGGLPEEVMVDSVLMGR